MDAATYLRGLLRSWWLVVVAVLAGAGGGYITYDHEAPQYDSSVTFIVALASQDADALSARTLTELRAGKLAQVAPTTPVLEATARSVQLEDSLAGVAVGATQAGAFVTIRVTGPNPEVAQALAAAYPAVAPDAVDELSGGTSTKFDVNIVSTPQLATKPFAPNRNRFLGFGVLGGLVIGLALSVLRETLNNAVRNTRELGRESGLEILGVVPKDLPKETLPAQTHPRSARAEAYRQIRTSLLSSKEKRPLVVAVTSASPSEGKTSVSANLAVVMSRAGHSVALVDADLRRPRIADFVGVDRQPGLTEVLLGQITVDQALQLRDEGRFAVLSSGSIPANPSEALGSQGMGELLRELAARFEFVIIDTPPVLPVTDALVLAPWLDGLVVVGRVGRTTPDRLQRIMDAASRAKVDILGIVANQAGKGTDADYSYTYRSAAKGAKPEVVPVGEESDTHGRPTTSGRHSNSSRPEIPVSGPTDVS